MKDLRTKVFGTTSLSHNEVLNLSQQLRVQMHELENLLRDMGIKGPQVDAPAVVAPQIDAQASRSPSETTITETNVNDILPVKHERDVATPAPTTINSQKPTKVESSPLAREDAQEDQDVVRQLMRGHEAAWDLHEDTITQRYLSEGVPKSFVETKIVVQKQGFALQARKEIHLLEEQARAAMMVSHQGPYGMSPADNDAEHSLWELSSTEVWKYFEGGMSWSQTGWTPGGFLRITTNTMEAAEDTGKSSIIADFGDCVLEAKNILLPSRSLAEAHELKARNHHGGEEIPVTL
ncbi:hypothetical protein NX059_007150 [Plenodomus lindquistii]|nr:hypothetical protein NX059_007150 [Plenodomus lindquistii]